MSDQTITVEIPIEEARSVSGSGFDGRLALDHAKRITTALAAHDAAANPLESPWEATQFMKQVPKGWGIRFSDKILRWGLTEAQARHMSAAPELADALAAVAVDEFREDLHRNYNGGHHGNEDKLEAFHHGMDTVCNAIVGLARAPLEKAGRR